MTSSIKKSATVVGLCVAFGIPSGVLAQVVPANQAVVNGVEMDLGVVPAEAVRELPPASRVEHVMHRGAPGTAAAYHVNLSLFGSVTHAPIGDAEVVATVERFGMGRETKRLEAMTINGFVSYGNYFAMPGRDPYRITVVVRRPGASIAQATFEYKHE